MLCTGEESGLQFPEALKYQRWIAVFNVYERIFGRYFMLPKQIYYVIGLGEQQYGWNEKEDLDEATSV